MDMQAAALEFLLRPGGRVATGMLAVSAAQPSSTPSWLPPVAGAVGVVLGACVAGVFGFASSWYTLKKQREFTELTREDQRVQSFNERFATAADKLGHAQWRRGLLHEQVDVPPGPHQYARTRPVHQDACESPGGIDVFAVSQQNDYAQGGAQVSKVQVIALDVLPRPPTGFDLESGNRERLIHPRDHHGRAHEPHHIQPATLYGVLGSSLKTKLPAFAEKGFGDFSPSLRRIVSASHHNIVVLLASAGQAYPAPAGGLGSARICRW
ncbi:MAG: hypothetical protein ACLP5E_08375 [Streptosporangiaceae bacterium]